MTDLSIKLKGSNTIWTAAEAAKATGGRTQGEWSAQGLSIDTRSLQKGDLFIALRGEKSDGHDYVLKALAAGAAAVMIDHRPEGLPADAPVLLVKDTFTALQDLGRASRARSGAQVIGVTGSVGKTGTKELLAAAFGALGQTHASKASFNNHWGVPFTLSAMHAGCDYGIFEMGMNHSGEITPLSQMVQPGIAIITTVAPVHLGNFSSEEEIAHAKAEIFDGMAPGGTAILNIDNMWFGLLAEKAREKGLRVISFGENEKADVRMKECLEAANGSRVTARVLDEDITFTLLIAGRHIAHNALSVLAAIKAAGGDARKAAEALSGLQPVSGRGRREYIESGEKGNPITLIDESYNASPVAMKAAFKVLALVDPGRGGRRIAILGDMYELGPQAAQMHRELSLPLEAAGVNLVYTCGPLMKNLYDALPEKTRGAHQDDNVELARIVPEVLVPGDVVLVKGSRGGGEKPRMQVIVEALRTLPEKMKRITPNAL